MADTERKLLLSLDKTVKASEKGLMINSKKREYMVVTKRNSERFKLQIRDIR